MVKQEKETYQEIECFEGSLEIPSSLSFHQSIEWCVSLHFSPPPPLPPRPQKQKAHVKEAQKKLLLYFAKKWLFRQ